MFTNAPCKTACLYNAPSMHTLDIFGFFFPIFGLFFSSFLGAAKGVRQKEFGKKVSKKVTEASEKDEPLQIQKRGRPAAKGVRQKEFGKRTCEKSDRSIRKVTKKSDRKRKKVIELLLPHSFCESKKEEKNRLKIGKNRPKISKVCILGAL